MDSSLANWDGSHTPQKNISPAMSTASSSTSTPITPHPKLDTGNANPAAKERNNRRNHEGSGSSNGQVQAQKTSADRPSDASRLYFGAPREILRQAPPAHSSQSSSLGAALIPSSSLNSKTSLAINVPRPLLRAPTMPMPTRPPAPKPHLLSSASSLPTFGAPGPALLPSNHNANSNSTSSALSMGMSTGMGLGAALGHHMGGAPMGISLGMGRGRAPSALNSPTALQTAARAPSPPTPPVSVPPSRRESDASARISNSKSKPTVKTKPKAEAGTGRGRSGSGSGSRMGSSPLSSLSPEPSSGASASSSANGARAAGSWWAGVYSQDDGHATTKSTASSSRTGKAKLQQEKHGKEREKEKEKNLKAVRYESKMYKVKEEEKDAGGRSKSKSTKRDTDNDDPLFIASPELAYASISASALDALGTYASDEDEDEDEDAGPPGPGVHELFTPPPEGMRFDVGEERDVQEEEWLFTPPPPPPRERAGSGVARRVAREEKQLTKTKTKTKRSGAGQKRKREEMEYVLVPRAAYPLHKRARVRKEWAVVVSKSASASGQRMKSESTGRSRSWVARGRRGREDDSSSDDDDDADDRGRGWSRAVSHRSAGAVKTKPRMKTKSQASVRQSKESENEDEDDGEEDAEPSLGDVLNRAWAHNERGGTIPIGKAVSEAAVAKSVPRRRAADRAPSREKENGAEKEKERRVRRAPRPRDEELLAVPAAFSPSPSKRRRPIGWCDQPTADGVVRLRWDVEVEEADRAAAVALGVDVAEWVHKSRPVPCLVWPWPPRDDGGGEVSGGGPVRGLWAEAEGKGKGRQRLRDEGVKVHGGTKAVKAPRGRSMQSGIQGLSSPVWVSSSQMETEMQAGPSTLRMEQSPMLVDELQPDFMSGFPQASHSAPPLPSFSSPFTSNAMSSIAAQTGLDADTDVEMPSLSVKAWGKQKARTPSPDTWIQQSGSRSGSRGPHSRRTSASHAMRSPVEDFSAYLNPLDPSPPRMRMHPSNRHITAHGLHYYPTNPTTPAASGSAPMAVMNEPEPELEPEPEPHPEPQSPEFYLPSLDTEPYGNGTVDPSLLGGAMMLYEPGAEEHEREEHEMDHSYEREDEDVQMRSSSPSGSSSYEEVKSPVARPSSHPPSAGPSIPPTDMVLDDLVHSFDDNSSSSDYAPPVAASTTDDVPPSPASPQLKPTPIPKSEQNINRPGDEGGETKVDDNVVMSVHSADRFFRYSLPWPLGDSDTLCHQCRNRSKLFGMKHETCGHVYCVRCIMRKYEPNTIAFVPTAPNSDCPKCNGTCSCDICCTRRGETYQRIHRLPEERQASGESREPGRRPRGPRVPRTVPKARPKQSPYHVIDQQIIVPTTFYATMYDMNGVRIAKTFLGADGDDAVVVAKPARGPRVFIGSVATEWKLGPDPEVSTERTPLPGKRARGHTSGRFCIGDESALWLRVRPRASAALQLPEPEPIGVDVASVEVNTEPAAAAPPEESESTVPTAAVDLASGDADPAPAAILPEEPESPVPTAAIDLASGEAAPRPAGTLPEEPEPPVPVAYVPVDQPLQLGTLPSSTASMVVDQTVQLDTLPSSFPTPAPSILVTPPAHWMIVDQTVQLDTLPSSLPTVAPSIPVTPADSMFVDQTVQLDALSSALPTLAPSPSIPTTSPAAPMIVDQDMQFDTVDTSPFSSPTLTPSIPTTPPAGSMVVDTTTWLNTPPSPAPAPAPAPAAADVDMDMDALSDMDLESVIDVDPITSSPLTSLADSEEEHEHNAPSHRADDTTSSPSHRADTSSNSSHRADTSSNSSPSPRTARRPSMFDDTQIKGKVPPFAGEFVRPPFDDLPDSVVLVNEEMNYSVMHKHPTWFLDIHDFVTLDASRDGAIRYPRDLEPPRPQKQKDLLVRCTFCPRTYTGANAKSMWTRHVREKHRVVLSKAWSQTPTSSRRQSTGKTGASADGPPDTATPATPARSSKAGKKSAVTKKGDASCDTSASASAEVTDVAKATPCALG